MVKNLNLTINIDNENNIATERLTILDSEDEFYVTDSQPNFISLSSNILNYDINTKNICTDPKILSL